jgi:hypothetical protein
MNSEPDTDGPEEPSVEGELPDSAPPAPPPEVAPVAEPEPEPELVEQDPSETDDAVEYRVRGSKPELTRRLHDFIIEQIKAGSYRNRAASAAGIAVSTFYRWLTKGRDELARMRSARGLAIRVQPELKRFADFYLDVERAEADAELDCVTIIRNAAVSNWSAAAWLLERKFPERYTTGRVLKIQIETEQEEFLAKLEKRLPQEVFDAVLLAATEPELEEVGEVAARRPDPGAGRKARGRKADGAKGRGGARKV